ncbi:MAG: ABC transporter ATP-binding protein [Bacillaceae bacterium]
MNKKGSIQPRMGPMNLVGGAKAKNLKETLMRLTLFFSKEKKQVFIVFFFVFCSTAFGIFVPFLIGRGIDTMSAGKGNVHLSLLHTILLILFIGYVIDAVITFMQGWIMTGVVQRTMMLIKETLFDKFHKLPFRFFDNTSDGDTMSRLSNDMDNIGTTLSSSITGLMANSLMIIASFIMMIILSPILTLASMITIPMIFMLTKIITSKTKPLFKQQQETLGSLNGFAEETITNISLVKSFNREEKVISEFNTLNKQLNQIGVKAQIWSGFLMPLTNTINNIGFIAIAIVGSLLVSNDAITIGVIASFISYSKQFTRPVVEIASIYNTLQSAVASLERIFEVLDEKEEVEDIQSAIQLEDIKGEVAFHHVGFGYDFNHLIIQDINFQVSPGSKVAIVGPTGAGKSTIINLLTRFYDVTEGEIQIDQIPIKHISRTSLRKLFGIVLQDTYLFTGTIRENLRYGRLDATDEEIIEAARMANAHLFIEQLERGYDTYITENGQSLSHGQRQLLSITRALLANPKILILDEATSNIDTRTEQHVQQALSILMKGRTSIVIAHRLNTIANADLILVIDDGKIVERGNHEQLLRLNGRYKQLYEIQKDNEK